MFLLCAVDRQGDRAFHGFSKSIVAAVIDLVGSQRAMRGVLVCAVLTYGGVSLFVVVFAAYPFAAEMFRAGNIPKRLIPGTIALGAFSFTMDSLPFSPQIQNIIPTTYFKTTNGAAPILGSLGAIFILVLGMTYLEWRRRQAAASGEGYGEDHSNEPPPVDTTQLAPAFVAFLPLIVVFVVNLVLGGFPGVFGGLIDYAYGANYDLTLALDHSIPTPIAGIKAIWAVEGALAAGILTVFAFAFPQLSKTFAEGSKAAVGGALLAAMNTASEYGFGGVIAALPGFLVIKDTSRRSPIRWSTPRSPSPRMIPGPDGIRALIKAALTASGRIGRLRTLRDTPRATAYRRRSRRG